MKIEFRVLWVDDNLDWILAVQTPLTTWLENKGFELKIISHTDTKGVINDIKQEEVDLIVVDYKLGDERGDTLIQDIRSCECYQDIIFYSEGDLPNKQLDGVFFVQRESAKERIKELIDLKLKRLSDPVSIRGWIVADTIELEWAVTEILSGCFEDKKELSFSTRLLGHNGPLEFGAKYRLLSGILKDRIEKLDPNNIETLTKWKNCKDIFNKFIDEIIHVRNAIAHQKVEELEEGKVIKTLPKNMKDLVLNEETFIDIRKNIIKHRDNLNNILELISK